jgi:hypothetical protein
MPLIYDEKTPSNQASPGLRSNIGLAGDSEMATLAQPPFVPAPATGDERYILSGAILKTGTNVRAFS